eukprot:13556993-Alexandrium_andersonii.AAC.2
MSSKPCFRTRNNPFGIFWHGAFERDPCRQIAIVVARAIVSAVSVVDTTVPMMNAVTHGT